MHDLNRFSSRPGSIFPCILITQRLCHVRARWSWSVIQLSGAGSGLCPRCARPARLQSPKSAQGSREGPARASATRLGTSAKELQWQGDSPVLQQPANPAKIPRKKDQKPTPALTERETCTVLLIPATASQNHVLILFLVTCFFPFHLSTPFFPTTKLTH